MRAGEVELGGGKLEGGVERGGGYGSQSGGKAKDGRGAWQKHGSEERCLQEVSKCAEGLWSAAYLDRGEQE